VRLKLEEIPELPADNHSFFLLPEKSVELSAGKEIVYRDAGRGKPVLLLHGLWTSAYTFRALIEPLSSRFRLVMPELTDPAGLNPLPDEDYRPAAMVSLIVDLIRGLDLVSPLIVGHAESGLAAMQLAIEKPESLCALVTLGMPIEQPARLRLQGWLRAKPHFAERWAQKGFARPHAAACEMIEYADPTVVSRQEIRRMARYWSTLRGARATSRILAGTLSSAYARESMQVLAEHMDRQGKFPVPLKLVYGQDDRRATVGQGEKLNRLIPGSELLIADQSTGAVQVERPDWTAGVIERAAST
jgi:pimeloyl-ACP methyl ester carboxylesterase